MLSFHPRHLSRFFAYALALAPVVFFSMNGASCRGVVAGNDRDAAADLCALLGRCYGQTVVDCSTFADRFGASPTTDDRFLAFMSQNDCLSTCDAAKKCWDYPPICAAEGACSSSEQCCGFTSGLEACNEDRCCTPPGVPCDGSRDTPCCGNIDCVPSPAGPLTCGGVPACFDIGAKCTFAIDCCSKSCVNGACQQKTCSLIGEKCGTGNEGPTCCALDGDAAQTPSCVAGVCVVESCAGDACTSPVTCDPHAPPSKSCCGNPAFHCVPDVAGTFGVCLPVQTTAMDHVPDGFDCAFDSDCCPGHSCITAGVNKCAAVAPTCVPTGGGCAASATMQTECCSGQCVNAKCTCGNTTCHSPFDEGPAIACSPGQTDADIHCTDDLVCGVDPFCCCNEWDSICVSEATTLCGH